MKYLGDSAFQGGLYIYPPASVYIYTLETGARKWPEETILDNARFILNLPRKLKKVDVVKECAFHRA